MADDGGGSISAGKRLERARDGAEEVEGDAVGLWARRIEVEWRGVVGTRLDGGSARAQLDPRA